MPIYVFICAKNHKVEHILSFADRDKPRKCEVCGKPTKIEDFPGSSSWHWGDEVTAWDGGLSSNPYGLSRAKRPDKR